MKRTILVVHGGMGDETSWVKVTDLLGDTVRFTRRQYDRAVPRKVTIADEVEQVREIAAGLDRPLLVGHSSGAVVALEALVADPGLYRGGVLYEPPLVVDEPLGGDKLVPARQAIADGKPGKALSIFLHDVVEMGAVASWFLGQVIGHRPELAWRVERQLDDSDAIDGLGCRLPAYAKLDLPILLLGGDRSPAHLGTRLDALRRVLPNAARLTMHGQGHTAEQSAPQRVARAIAEFDES
jgi:pimeloyl-ACP methyl ester carboxylesterase